MESMQHEQMGAAEGPPAQDQSKAQRLVGKAQEQVGGRVSASAAQLKGQASGVVGNFAEAIRQVGQQYREQNRGLVGDLAERGAQEAQRLAEYLERTDVDDLVRQLEGVARRRPAAFYGGAFALGLAGARFLKSSRRQRDTQLGRGAGAEGSALAGAGLGAFGDSSGASGGAFAADRDVTARQPLTQEGAAGRRAGGADAPPPLADVDALREPRIGAPIPPAPGADRLR